MKLAMQQSQDLARARQMIEGLLGGKVESPKDSKQNSEKSRPSPTKSKLDLTSHFSEPPAPPPQAPLPEKPDVARALADPVIRPLLRRDETALTMSNASSLMRTDHSSDILRLCEELKIAKGELSNQSERMKSLETQLAQERTARESAEERAQRAESRDSPANDKDGNVSGADEAMSPISPPVDLQGQLDRLKVSMDEIKQQMEAYKRRAEAAEVERDEAKQTLAELVEQKRKENAERATTTISARSTSKSRKSTMLKRSSQLEGGKSSEANGHVVLPQPESPTGDILLERAGIEEGQPITLEQAKIMTRLLSQEVLRPHGAGHGDRALTYYGRPYGSAAAVLVLGVVLMTWVNSWPKVER